MSLKAEQIEMLKRLAERPLTVVDFKMHGELRMVQNLSDMGYVRDFAKQLNSQGRPHRVPVHLRIWGITDAGRAILEQKALADRPPPSKEYTEQLSFEFNPRGANPLRPASIGRAGLTIKVGAVRRHTIIQRKKGLPTAVYENRRKSQSATEAIIEDTKK